MLTLHPTLHPQRPAVAAFLAGAEPLGWLRELDRWGVAPEQLTCYVVPESLASVRAAGLLVVPTGGAAALPPDLREPLGVVAGRLYLPVAAALRPAATAEELDRLLRRYAVLCWHPRHGLVGFDAEDALPLSNLASPGPARPADWTLARPGPPAPPPLRQIRVQPPTLAQVLDQGRADIGTAPLADLPELPAPPSALAQALAALERGALRTGLAAGRALGTGLAALGAGLAAGLGAGSGGAGGGQGGAGGRSGAGEPEGPGPLDRLRSFMRGRLDDLERQRHQELQRLLRLLDQDPGQGLRFAIPLDSPYLHRGTGAPGSRLGARASTDFRLGELGGGQRVDGWELGEFESQLRERYRRAADQATAAGQHRQAAYIQAQLLGDYRAAAQALERGGHFREAAVLLQDHLRDPFSAAGVLERGGLLPEAIELFVSLNAFEKAADLHQQLGQPAEAAALYERALGQGLANGKTLEAARLLAEKLNRPAEAEALLLAGWTGARQPEPCLREYLRLLVARRPAAELPAAVRTLAERHTPPERRGRLLDGLLAHLPLKNATPALRETVHELGLDIIAAEVAAGQPRRLHLLRQLAPHDRLLPGDASRFLAAG